MRFPAQQIFPEFIRQPNTLVVGTLSHIGCPAYTTTATGGFRVLCSILAVCLTGCLPTHAMKAFTSLSLMSFQQKAKKARGITTIELVNRFNMQVNKTMEQIKLTDEATPTEYRGIGRANLPSTVIGLLFYAAEHTMRHVGQLMVTAAVVLNDTLMYDV